MLRPEFHMVSGRMFRPGTRELIVGVSAKTQFRSMNVGDKVILPDGEWPIVGSFTTGDLLDGQLIGDTETVMKAIRKPAYNSVLVRLASPSSFAIFKRALTTNPALAVDPILQSDWYKKISAGFSTFFKVIAYGIGIIMGIGALFGCFNTMYAAVAARAREIATLRAIGYGAFPVAVSVILEAVALSVGGALIGAAIAWTLYDGVDGAFGPKCFQAHGFAVPDRDGGVVGRGGGAVGRAVAVHSCRPPPRGRSIESDMKRHERQIFPSGFPEDRAQRAGAARRAFACWSMARSPRLSCWRRVAPGISGPTAASASMR